MPLSPDIQHLADVFEALRPDVDEFFEAARREQKSSLRRAAIRALFAFIEGVVFAHKRVTLASERPYRPEALSAGDRAVLLEQSYDLDDQGRLSTRPLFLSIAKNVRFTFASFSRVFGSSFVLDTGGEGWQAFRKAVVIRNRIVHPKSAVEAEVSLEELETAWKAYGWFSRAFALASLDAIKALREDSARMRAETEALRIQMKRIQAELPEPDQTPSN